MQNDFFNVVSVREFINFIQKFEPINRQESVHVKDAINYIFAEDLYAPENLPPFSRSSMDGYAVLASDIFGASESNPAYLECIEDIPVNTPPERTIQSAQCSKLSTGSILPSCADSVVMLEYCEKIGDSEIEIRKPVAPGENVMHQGEDCSTCELVFSAGRKIRTQEIGLLSALGFSQVPVFSKPVIGVITTGDELVDIDENPAPGQIRDVNSYTLLSWIKSLDCRAKHYGIVGDCRSTLNQMIQEAVQQCDLVLVTGGSSVGTRDITLDCFHELGNVYVHGVSISPGKPTILANINNVPVFGLPGQVTSSLVVAIVLVVPFIRYISAEANFDHNLSYPTKTATLGRNVSSKPGREDYVRVSLLEDEMVVIMLFPCWVNPVFSIPCWKRTGYSRSIPIPKA